MEPKSTDPVTRPAHYVGAFTGKECKDFMRDIAGDANMALFWRLSAIKYLYRADRKQATRQDLEKAKRCLEYALECMSEVPQ